MPKVRTKSEKRSPPSTASDPYGGSGNHALILLRLVAGGVD
jgi:hypothetical protein